MLSDATTRYGFSLRVYPVEKPTQNNLKTVAFSDQRRQMPSSFESMAECHQYLESQTTPANTPRALASPARKWRP
ncbi:hypothetical protein O988_01222 [Pseudogymnoascus sp. VKM F-3808]|nr:hypothetical protein O988_01222 [Pseudogymnoascus sp. VKM F-3808]